MTNSSLNIEHLPLIDVPVGALVEDDFNVRKSAPSDAGIQALAASIKAKGLLQNMVVRKKPRKKFGVVAGSRRTKALQLLVDQGDLEKTATVSCRLAPDAMAKEISLAENTQREDMHVADEIAAWWALAQDGMPIKEIAGRHGVSEAIVKKRLALGSLSPVLIDALRANEIDLNIAMAFTLTSDHKEQETVYTALKERWGEVHAHHVRKAITKSEIAGTSQLARFVGAEAYLEAGGSVREDLFENVTYFQDWELVQKLAKEKIEAEEERLLDTGWLWIKFEERFQSWDAGRNMRRVYPQPKPLSDEDAAKVADLEKQLQAFAEKDEEESDEALKLAEDIALIEGEHVYRESDILIAGGWFTIDLKGAFEYHLGFIRKGDDPRLKKLAKSGKDAPVRSPYGKSLNDDLAHVYWTIMRRELMSNPIVAADLLQFEMIRAYHQRSYVFEISAKSPDGRRVYSEAGAMGELVGEDIFEAAIADVPLSWIETEDTAKAFDAYRKLSAGDKTKLLAFVAAHSLDAILPRENGETAGFDRAAILMKTNVRAHWRPGEAFFGRIRKGDLLEIGASVINPAWAEARQKEKKAEIVTALAAVFDGSAPSLTAAVKKRAASWLPEPLQVQAKGKAGTSSPKSS